MKKITYLLFVAIILLLATGVKAQWLTVGDPQEEWWYYNEGTIEEAELVVKPQGLYLAVDMYLTFSGRDMYYTAEDTIEFVCNFDLPYGSHFYDSWLWFNQDTLIAELMDRWTASTIYNEIVGRRQDPSILYKTWGNEYELRIYPMQGDSTRKVKLSYLTPFSFYRNKVTASLPLDLLKASYNEVENVKLKMFTNSQWKNPAIFEYPDLTFESTLNSNNEVYDELTFNTGDFDYPFSLEYDSPMKDGIFFNYLVSDENFYQLAILPSVFVDEVDSKNILVCVDHKVNSFNDKTEIYGIIKNAVSNGLNKNDYVNIMFSAIDIKPVFESWVKVEHVLDSIVALEQANILSSENISDYSNLPTLLNEGFKHLAGNNGSVLYLIANTEGYGNPESANGLMDDLMDARGANEIAFYAADFLPYPNEYYWIGSTYYHGNEYLYVNLAKQTNGNAERIESWNETLDMFIYDFTQTIDGTVNTFDLHTTVSDGFCYSRLDLNKSTSMVHLNKPVMQVGKYYGDFPFTIEVAGLYNDKPFNKVITIEKSSVSENDSLLEEIWAGNYIEKLEGELEWYSNEAIREIIDYSIQERVLSQYTAFLAIEPNAIDSLQSSDFNEDNDGDWGDDEWLLDISNEETNVEELSVKVYPNPFESVVTFKFDIDNNASNQPVTVKIYDITGKLIFEDIAGRNTDRTFEYEWNGKDTFGREVERGTYIIVFETNKTRKVSKAVKS